MNANTLMKSQVIAVIILFIGVAVAPSINFKVVKASKDNDIVEVTSQACGIQGFGNTTVKLTKEQYQDLEQYLVDFRARLNQTTTLGEAVPIFKEAVVELNKYGLLPKGMGVEKAQKLVLRFSQYPRYLRYLDRIQHNKLISDYENYYCLIAGHTTYTASQGLLMSIINLMTRWYYLPSFFLGFIILGNMISAFNPILIFSILGIGLYYQPFGYPSHSYPSNGWISTIGLYGFTNWTGNFYGAINNEYMIRMLGASFYPAVIGFFGIIIHPLINVDKIDSYYIGSTLKIKLSTSPSPP